jgi:hypothetical protein
MSRLGYAAWVVQATTYRTPIPELLLPSHAVVGGSVGVYFLFSYLGRSRFVVSSDRQRHHHVHCCRLISISISLTLLHASNTPGCDHGLPAFDPATRLLVTKQPQTPLSHLN